MSGIMNVSLFSFVLILSSKYKTVYTGFNHEVKPTCASPEEECSVDLHVSYIMSMVTYNWTTSQGYPVYYSNGSFYRKLSTTSGSSPNRTAELFEDPLNDDGKITKSLYTYVTLNEFFSKYLVILNTCADLEGRGVGGRTPPGICEA